MGGWLSCSPGIIPPRLPPHVRTARKSLAASLPADATPGWVVVRRHSSVPAGAGGRCGALLTDSEATDTVAHTLDEIISGFFSIFLFLILTRFSVKKKKTDRDRESLTTDNESSYPAFALG